MSQEPSKLIIDPFYDSPRSHMGAGDAGVQYADPNHDSSRYHDVTDPNIPRGPRGLTGVIIPSATREGYSPARNPNRPSGITVHVDPDIKGQSISLDAAAFNKEILNAATDEVDAMGVDPAIRASTIMMVAARIAKDGQAVKTAAAPAPVQTPVQYVPAPTPIWHDPSAERVSYQPPRDTRGPLQILSSPLAHAPVELGPVEPTQGVYFEIEHFGTQEAYYHAVVRAGKFLILALQERYKGHRYMPGNIASQIGVAVEGWTDVFIVQATNIKFKHNGYEYCVLMIDKEGPRPQE